VLCGPLPNGKIPLVLLLRQWLLAPTCSAKRGGRHPWGMRTLDCKRRYCSHRDQPQSPSSNSRTKREPEWQQFEAATHSKQPRCCCSQGCLLCKRWEEVLPRRSPLLDIPIRKRLNTRSFREWSSQYFLVGRHRHRQLTVLTFIRDTTR